MLSSIFIAQALVAGLAVASPVKANVAVAATTTSVPGTVATAGSFVYQLCAVEPFYNGVEARTLHGATQISSSMTVEMCASYCSGFQYFGVEYNDECYCGNVLHNATTQDTVGGCNYACAGNTAEVCGGSGRMDFYQQATITTSLTLPKTYAVATATATPISGYNYVDCVVEPLYNGGTGRVLQATSTTSNAMTLEYCASFCSGYTYFGVEYSSECYCGNTINNQTVTDNSSCGCNMGCTGNDAEACGGNARLGLYELAGSVVPSIPAGTPTGSCAPVTGYATTQTLETGTAFTTSTVLPTGTVSGTVYNIYPAGYYTTTTVSSGYYASTTTLAPAAFTAVGTVEVVVPTTTAGYGTTQVLESGSAFTTMTVAPSGTQSGTVYVVYPSGYYTTTTLSSGYYASTTTWAPAASTAVGTIEVIIPTTTAGTQTVTIVSGSLSSTTTLAAAIGSSSGTVEIIVPTAGYVYTTTVSGAASSTTTLATASGTMSGTIEVVVPSATGYVTMTSEKGSFSTVSTVTAPSGTVSGTVVAYYPSGYYTTTTVYGSTAGTTTLQVAASTAVGTVQVNAATASLIATTLTVETGTAFATTTIAPTGTVSGTVIDYFAAGYATTTTIISGTASTTKTTTIVTAGSTAVGNVQVIVPSATGYATTLTVETLTGFSTVTIAPTGTVSGTVIDYYSSGYVTATSTYWSKSTTSTSTITPAASNVVGYVELFLPCPSGYTWNSFYNCCAYGGVGFCAST